MLIDYLKMYLETAAEGGEQPGAESPVPEATPEGGTETPPEQVPEPVSEFDIDGEKFTLDQIKEFRKGYLRQSDYTRKTQEISAQRKEHEQALEVYNYLKNNPEVAQKLAEYSPENKPMAESLSPAMQKVEALEMQFKTLELEKQLESITTKDKDVNEVELLTIAKQARCDINTAYNIWRGQNVDKILAKRLAEQSKQMTEQIQKNSGITKTLITPGDKQNNNASFGLTPIELSMAEKLNMTPEEYAKWK